MTSQTPLLKSNWEPGTPHVTLTEMLAQTLVEAYSTEPIKNLTRLSTGCANQHTIDRWDQF